MMKELRLEMPLMWRKNVNEFSPRHSWLKVDGNRTEAYADSRLTEILQDENKKITLEIRVPEELETVEISESRTEKSIDCRYWLKKLIKPAVNDLKRIIVCFNNSMVELAINEGEPDIKDWEEYIYRDESGKWLFTCPWAMVVYITNARTYANFYWHIKT